MSIFIACDSGIQEVTDGSFEAVGGETVCERIEVFIDNMIFRRRGEVMVYETQTDEDSADLHHEFPRIEVI